MSIEVVKHIAELAEAASTLGIALHDHIVIGHKGRVSLRSLGLE